MKYTDKLSVVMKWYRVERWFYEKKLRLPAKLVYHMIQILFGCTIPYSTVLEEGVNIAHFHGVVLHQNSRVGAGTVIHSNVCLGGRNGKGGPNVGKRCVLGTGAVILGEITIGDDVNVGANSVVLEDVPSGCTVVGAPARIVRRAAQ